MFSTSSMFFGLFYTKTFFSKNSRLYSELSAQKNVALFVQAMSNITLWT